METNKSTYAILAEELVDGDLYRPIGDGSTVLVGDLVDLMAPADASRAIKRQIGDGADSYSETIAYAAAADGEFADRAEDETIDALPPIEIIEVEETQATETGATLRVAARVGGVVCAWYAWRAHDGTMIPSGDSLDCWVPPAYLDHPRAAEIGFEVIAAAAAREVLP